MKTQYQLLAPNGKTVLGTGECPLGMTDFIEKFILCLDDHATYSVATYRESAVMPGKSYLVVQNNVEDFRKQVRDQFG